MTPRKKNKNKRFSITNYINGLLHNLVSSIKLFNEYVNTTTVSDYKKWKLTDDKPLKLAFIEWFFERFLFTILVGVWFACSVNIKGFTGDVFIGALVYWLLFRVILVVKNR